MSESLPLIPDKGGAVCADVRPVLREVFRECGHLPPLAARRSAGAGPRPGDTLPPTLDQWVEKYDSEREDVWQREGKLKQQYAKRLSREPLPNIYRLHEPTKTSYMSSWMAEQGFIERRDLVPSIMHKSDVEGTLWVKNILNRSSGELTPMVVRGTRVPEPVCLGSPRESSLQSISIGSLRPEPAPPAPARPPPPPDTDHVVCVPPQLDFINFTVGELHSQAIRLVNVSKFEVKLSVRPPSAAELDVELCGSRGLTVTSGSAAEFKIHFRPRDVRAVHDVLLVRVSTGRLLNVPISCYMQPPFLDILVPAVSSSILSCTPGHEETSVVSSSECVELGARLLGDVHCVPVVLYCEAEHAAFFLLTEDSWLSFNVDVVSRAGSVVSEPFAVWPAWWRGGGAVRGGVWCRARAAGLQTAALRLVASTAVVRPLHLIADVLYFRPDHITLQAHERDYDICSEDDPACEYYVHLGTAFPHRSLSATVQIVNHSPVVYSYYWSVRPWGVCSCWNELEQKTFTLDAGGDIVEEDSDLCVGAKEERDRELRDGPPDPSQPTNAGRLRVEPAGCTIGPRSTCTVHVCAPDVGGDLGVQRAVLMLVLKDIPKESLPDDYDPMVVKTETVKSDRIPGVQHWNREVCELVCTQMEVWWDVAPVRFVLDPPLLDLDYSRRVTEVEVTVRATQLFGSEGVSCGWRVPAHVAPPAPLALTAAHSCPAPLLYRLPELPNHFPDTDIITLEAASAEWRATSEVTRRCATRHPALRPARRWLGVVPPGASLRALLDLHNDTYQHICWWATPFRWFGENPPSEACRAGARAREPCARCQERACTCGLVRPARGALHHRDRCHLAYAVHAPDHDGCVATLVKAQRTSADVARVAGGAASEARASLLAYRVLAPRIALRVLPCEGDKHASCECCALDEGCADGARGTATLRPLGALSLAARACYRLRLTNTTPLPTAVAWDPPLEEDYLKVLFFPNECEVSSYAQVEIRVVLEPRRVCGRRVFLRRARVQHAYKPLYLVIDAAISGLEIVCEVPLGGGENTETTVIMRRTQPEVYPWEASEDNMPETFEEIFAEEDKKRAVRVENKCHCHFEMEYVPPPPPRPSPPLPEGEYPPIEILLEPPPLTRVCACHPHTQPVLPAFTEGYCLQFHRLPLRTVRTRTVVVRNESAVVGAWRAACRRWPRRHRPTLDADEWAGDVREPGVCVSVRPRAGTLGPHARLALTVAVYADCWGLYRDQLAIKVEGLEAIVLDLWVEAEGAPLHFALARRGHDAPALCWMSSAEPARSLRVKNASRAALAVHAYVLVEHEYPQDELPFRLYLRLFDVEPATCPCLREWESSLGTYEVEKDTGVELVLAPDRGRQTDHYYSVSPESCQIPAGEWATWSVRLAAAAPRAPAPRAALLLRAAPLHASGEGWVRLPPAAQWVRLRHAARAGCLRLACRELRVRLCALDLPAGDSLRVRKRFRVQNVGNGPLEVGARTRPPWAVVAGERAACGAGCVCGPRAPRRTLTALTLPPRSSFEMCVEVVVRPAEALPTPAPASPPAPPALPVPAAPLTPPAPEVPPAATPPPAYLPSRETTTLLHFYDQDNILETLPLVLELEFPVLTMEPAVIDFGCITDGDTKKSYYTVAHSSRTVTLELCSEWEGGPGFRLHPRSLVLRPRARERIYIQYTARWCGAPVEGRVVVRAGAWCRAAAGARAAPARDVARRAPPADATDDARLLPPAAPRARCL